GKTMSIRRGTLGLAIILGAAGTIALSPAKAPSQTADSYDIDAVHSSVIFRIKHFNTSFFYGRFNEVSGTRQIDPATPTSGKVEVSIKTDSVDTHNQKRNDHLKSQDFFNAVKFPALTFTSKSVAKAGETTFDVTGDLTIHGQTKPVTVKLERTGESKSAQ